jgi:hypothetical protein
MALREWLWLWPVALVTVTATAIPIAIRLARPPETVAPPAPRYPLRVPLPPAAAPGEAAEGAVLEFDRAGRGSAADSAGSAIEIRKRVRVNGAEAGEATIRVGARSELSIAAGELRRALAAAGHGETARLVGAGGGGEGGAAEFVGFEALRGQGIEVRYDVGADRIAISL